MRKLYFILLVLIICFAGENLISQETRPEPKQSSNDIKVGKTPKEDLCVPEYSSGCGMGDGFTDFAVEEIQNYGSGCADLNGTGWSQYLELGPAILYPGFSHDFIMQTGYDNQYVTIWVDFNDDFELTEDEKILIDFVMDDAGQFYTASVQIPTDATEGIHYMRARTNWQNSASDPCESYGYGEAEDYYVIVGTAEMGSFEGVVTELDGGNPIEDATITIEGFTTYTTTTGSDGAFLIEYIFIGDYNVTCMKEGYNVETDVVTIEEDITTYLDFALTQPGILVDPLSITVNIPQNATQQESIHIENTGNGTLDWSASMVIAWDNSEDFLDLQFEYPVAQGGGEAGIESDGNYIYTTKWNGANILKYDIEGNYIESFTIDGVNGLRDLAFDGTYFYGSASIPVVFEMDFNTQELVGTFTAPVDVRAIAYNENEDVFYANNWSSLIWKFDKSGNPLNNFSVGPDGGNYYGFAYDQSSVGGPFLWGYAQLGDSQNELVQIQLPSGTETGFTMDVADKLTGPVFNQAGGLFTHPNFIYGKWTIGGVVQNQWIWGLELGDAQTWVWVEPNAGTLDPGNQEELTIHFNASELEPGEYNAQVHFNSYPLVGNPIIDVTMNVSSSPYYPCDLVVSTECTDALLQWGMCPAGSPEPDSFNIYRDYFYIVSVTDTFYSDNLLIPESEYSYAVTAMYDGVETSSVSNEDVSIPVPGSLEPINLHVSIISDSAYLVWQTPAGCLTPDGYNVYRDNELMGFYTGNSVPFEWGLYEFVVTAVYYFGESGPSNSVVITGSTDSYMTTINVFPNPVHDVLRIQSGEILSTLKLFNGKGQLIYSKQVNTTKDQLNLSGFTPGLYFIKLETLSGTKMEKILIE